MNMPIDFFYLPPPAHAQAHPAQAQAHAQPPENPPPPRPDERNVLEDGLGAGFVLLVTPLVKELTLPITPAENAETEFTTDAAAFEPGRLGRVIVLDLLPVGREGIEAVFAVLPEAVVLGRPMVGSARHHQ